MNCMYPHSPHIVYPDHHIKTARAIRRKRAIEWILLNCLVVERRLQCRRFCRSAVPGLSCHIIPHICERHTIIERQGDAYAWHKAAAMHV